MTMLKLDAVERGSEKGLQMDLQRVLGYGEIASLAGAKITVGVDFGGIRETFLSVRRNAELLGNLPGIEETVTEDYSHTHNFREDWAGRLAPLKRFCNGDTAPMSGSEFYRFCLETEDLAAIWQRHTGRNIRRHSEDADDWTT